MIARFRILARAIAIMMALVTLNACQEASQTVEHEPSIVSSVSTTKRVDCSALETRVRDIVSAYETDDAQVSVAFELLGEKDGGFQIDGDMPMASASTIKLAILATLFNAVRTGEVTLDQTLAATSQDVVAGTGTGIRTGEELPVRELAFRMIAESDNTASNVLLTFLGIDAVNDAARGLGLEQTNLDHRFMTPNPERDNLTSANDLVTLLKLIADEELVDAELSQLAQEFLLAQSDREALPAGLSPGVSIGNKTGTLTYARNDAGILYDASGVPVAVLAVMTNDMNEYEANRMMAEISSAVCDELRDEWRSDVG